MKNKCFISILSVICVIWFYKKAENNSEYVKDAELKNPNSHTCKDIFLEESIFKRNELVSEIELEYNYDYKNLLTCFHLDEKRFFNMPFVSYISLKKWIFQGFANHIYASDGQSFNPDSVNCGDIIYIKTDYLKDFIKNYQLQIKNPYILMTQQSDYKIGYPWHFDILNDPKIMKWYAINVIAKHPKLEPIPCGFAPPIGQDFSVLYNMSKSLTTFKSRSTLLYSNISPYKNRSIIIEYFKNAFKDNKNVVINENRIDWPTYLSHLRNSKFVLSPPGNGIDPHRTWESLAMGAVPIVLNQSEFQSLFDDMPVMVVNDWTEVTEESMSQFELKMNFSKDGTAWRPKLWLRYWITKIMIEKNNLLKQFC